MSPSTEQRFRLLRELGVDIDEMEKVFNRRVAWGTPPRIMGHMTAAMKEAKRIHRAELHQLRAYLQPPRLKSELELYRVAAAGDKLDFYIRVHRLLQYCMKTIPPQNMVRRYGAAGGAPDPGERP